MSDTTRRTDPEMNSADRLWDQLLLDVSGDSSGEAEQFVECFDTDQQGE